MVSIAIQESEYTARYLEHTVKLDIQTVAMMKPVDDRSRKSHGACPSCSDKSDSILLSS